MKKLLTILLTLLMVFTLVGCDEESRKQGEVVEDTTIDNVEDNIEDNKPEEQLAGGFVEVEDGTLTDELKDMFNLALEGLLGASYTPVKLVATQVVAGTNYKFLAEGTKTTNPITKGTYYVTIYEDLEGNVSVLDIETIEEKQEEVIEEPKKVDPTIYNYWVVVYDQLGNELSRTTAHYGTTVQDPDGNDVVVKGNTYFHTVVDYSPSKKESTQSNIFTITFLIGGSGYGYMLEKDHIAPSYPTGTQMQFPSGTNYSTDGDAITINGVTYIVHEVYGETFDHWECNGLQVASGQILEDSTLNAVFGPPA